MTLLKPNIKLGERGPFALLALLLFVNAVILESNEVVATSGFVSNVGVPQILGVWATDMMIVIVTSSIYSLIVDRVKRTRLAIGLFVGFSLVYIALYFLFQSDAPDWFSYFLLTVVTDQQWMLFPLLIWALANDLFAVAQAKRLFPLLGLTALAGGTVGNALAAVIAQVAQGSIELLLFNACLILITAAILVLALRRITVEAHQSRQDEKILDALREGLAFVREVPVYRYLTLAMVLLGFGFNIIEFHFLVVVSETFPDAAALQTFYGIFKLLVTVALLLLQWKIVGWLLEKVGFKWIFAFMPGALLAGLGVALVGLGVIGVTIGNYLARITLLGLDEPSRRAFQGLVPDERRGRVSAFLNGYLYPLGAVASCAAIGLILLVVDNGLLTVEAGRLLYLALGIVCAGIALWAAGRIRVYYDSSMLNWRLRRRQRGKSVLTDIEF